MQKTLMILTLISTLILTSCGGGGGGGGGGNPKEPITYNGTLHTFGNVSNKSGICLSRHPVSNHYQKQELTYNLDDLCYIKGGHITVKTPPATPPRDTCLLSTGLELVCGENAESGDCSDLFSKGACIDAGGIYVDNSGSSHPQEEICSETLTHKDICEASGGTYLENTGELYSIVSGLSQNFRLGNNYVVFPDLNTNQYQFESLEPYTKGISYPVSLTMNLSLGTKWKATVERKTSSEFYLNESNNNWIYSFSVNIPFSYNENVMVDSVTLLFKSTTF